MKNYNSIHYTFLQLVMLGIGRFKEAQIPKEVDWHLLKEISDKHTLTAIILDGLNSNDSKCADTMPIQMKLGWIGEVLHNYEGRYADYRKRIGELARFYNSHGFKLMLVKGYGLSLNWPEPSHRPCGDIDIWLFGQQHDADKELESWLKAQGSHFAIDTSHHHHTVFEWKGYTVENYYDFVNVHYGHGNAELEKIFKQLATDDSHYVEIDGERVYLPSPNLHALFLLRHCIQDFASAELNLRQVLDWAFLVEKQSGEIEWDWLIDTIKKFKMMDFFNYLNAICVCDLGFDSKIFPSVQFDPFLKQKVFSEILEPSFLRAEPEKLMPRLAFKYKRWKGNAWKQELCYHDDRLGSLFTGVWNHLLKPKTI